MLARIVRGRRVPAARLARRLYVYAFLDEFILLYPLYAVLFAESGLSTAQISSLFIIWSAAGIVLEIPSGVLADMVSRRSLLVVGPLLAGAGYALWVLVPSYPAFAAGFVLWGAHGALKSGAFEALVYTELDRLGSADSYARVIGRTQAASTVAVAAAMACAGLVFAVGGYPAVGAASVAACLACSVVAAGLPEHRDDDSGGAPGQGFANVLRTGVDEVRVRRNVRNAVVFLIAITVVWGALDEYVALLAVETGVRVETVPWVLLAVYAGVAAGGLLGEVAGRLPRWAVAGVLALGSAVLAVGAVVGHPIGFGLIGISFCVFQMVQIAADARLQHAITGPARSTVTSTAGFGTEVAMIGVYIAYGAASVVADHGTLFAASAGVYALLALAMLRWRRDRVPARPCRGRRIGLEPR